MNKLFYITDLPIWAEVFAFLGIVLFCSALVFFLAFFVHTTIQGFLNRSKIEENLYIDVSYFKELGKRERQEDALYISPLDKYNEQGFFAIVSDGMGGLAHGDEISSYIVKELSKIELDKFNDRKYIEGRIKSISNTIYNKYNREAGATLVMVRIYNNKLDIYSVGDSSILLIRDNRVTQLNSKQNYGSILISNMVRIGKTTELAYTSAQSHQLIDFIGNNNPTVKHTRSAFDLYDQDTIWITSDGVTDAVSFDEMIECNYKDAWKNAKAVKNIVKSKKLITQDNYTGVVIKLHKQIYMGI